MALGVERVRTTGTFKLDGGEWEVENNIWVVGDDREVVVIDAAHHHEPILAAVGGRTVKAVLLTHGHNDHINAAGPLAEATGAPILLHHDDQVLWVDEYPDRMPDGELRHGQVLEVGGSELRVLHTPGHSPGGVCVDWSDGRTLFSGDTLFQGGPGATGRSYSNFGTIIESIRSKLLVLPPETVVHTGHGDDTSIAGEAPHLLEWIDRGH
jgi:glyoxylase-like metal-dependent hydrolase (beta-lactamase superfamily II)